MTDDNVIDFPSRNDNLPIQYLRLKDGSVRTRLSFDTALQLLKEGSLVARLAWENTKQQYIYFVPSFSVRLGDINGGLEAVKHELGDNPNVELKHKPSIDMLTLFRHTEPWGVTIEDILATDWYLLRTKDEDNAG